MPTCPQPRESLSETSCLTFACKKIIPQTRRSWSRLWGLHPWGAPPSAPRGGGQVPPPPLGALATAAHSVLEPTACRLPALGSALGEQPPAVGSSSTGPAPSHRAAKQEGPQEGARRTEPGPHAAAAGPAAGLAKASGRLTSLPRGSRLRAPAHQSWGPPEGKGRVDSRSITTAAWPPHQRSECGAFVDHAIIPH